MAKFLRTLNTCTHRFFLIIAEISIIAMVVIVTMTVIMRYCFNTGISWAEEVPLLLVSLFAFLACAMGVRDHTHMSVTIIYNLLEKNGKGRKALDIFTDVCVLLCGLFMLYYGGQRCLKMMNLPGTLPMTGLRTWWQYLPIPLAGFLITFDSVLFLTGVIKPSETLFVEQDVDYSEQIIHMDKDGNIIASKAELEALEHGKSPSDEAPRQNPKQEDKN